MPPTVSNPHASHLSPAVSDGDLVALCRKGDGSAWRSLYERYSSSVFRFISAMGVPADEREDAAQEVFIAVYRSLGSFRGEAQLSTWIYRIASRHAGRLRNRRRIRDLVNVLVLREPPPPAPPDPAERAAHLDLLDQLLGRLNPKKRTVFVLFEVEGLPIEEIARILDCPQNTVWSRLHHARAEMLQLAQKVGTA